MCLLDVLCRASIPASSGSHPFRIGLLSRLDLLGFLSRPYMNRFMGTPGSCPRTSDTCPGTSGTCLRTSGSCPEDVCLVPVVRTPGPLPWTSCCSPGRGGRPSRPEMAADHLASRAIQSLRICFCCSLPGKWRFVSRLSPRLDLNGRAWNCVALGWRSSGALSSWKGFYQP